MNFRRKSGAAFILQIDPVPVLTAATRIAVAGVVPPRIRAEAATGSAAGPSPPTTLALCRVRISNALLATAWAADLTRFIEE